MMRGRALRLSRLFMGTWVRTIGILEETRNHAWHRARVGARGVRSRAHRPGPIDQQGGRVEPQCSHRLGFPRVQIATKLYGAIALTLIVVYGVVAVTTRFASETEQSVVWVQQEALEGVTLINDLEAAVEQQRQLVGSLLGARDKAERAARCARRQGARRRYHVAPDRRMELRRSQRLARWRKASSGPARRSFELGAQRPGRAGSCGRAAGSRPGGSEPAAQLRGGAPQARAGRAVGARVDRGPLARADHLGVRGRGRQRPADRPDRPAAAAPRAGAVCRASAGRCCGWPATTPRSRFPDWPAGRGRPARALGGGLQVRNRSSCCRRRSSWSGSTCSSTPPSTTCRWA